MNSNLSRAFAAALTVFGGAVPALAQFDWNSFCIDPNNTAPYAAGYNFKYQENAFFGLVVGDSSTVSYYASPDPCEGGGPIEGRIGFTIGQRGSIQDEINGSSFRDNNLRLTYGVSFGDQTDFTSPRTPNDFVLPGPPPGGMSYARIFVRRTTTAGAVTNDSYLFGPNLRLTFTGRGGRYTYRETTVASGGVNVRLIGDVLADTARLTWTLTNNLNTTDTVGLGLWFGQVVALSDLTTINSASPYYRYGYLTNFGTDQNSATTVYTTIPGRRPLTVPERFPDNTTNDPLVRTSTSVPPYVNFSVSQGIGYGLQVVNSPTALTQFDGTGGTTLSGSDQTPVDEFVFGDSGVTATPGLVDGHFNTSDPAFSDFIFNADGNGNNDAAPLGPAPGYVQKWQPTVAVGAGSARTIVAYYRSTNFDSIYSPQFVGYSVNVDTPKAIRTDTSTVNTDSPFVDLNGGTAGIFTIRVNVDNTGGFANPDTQVTMSSVDLVLRLPAGMTDPSTGSNVVTRSISTPIAPTGIGFVDFPVAVNPNLFGAQTYSVDITPNPGFSRKTVTGVINVATAPRLLVRSGPNLVSPPWNFTNPSWESVLALALNADFQAYKWDARAQRYVTQLNAERAVGTWIVSKNDLNYRSLALADAVPSQPTDQFPDPSNADVSESGSSPTVSLFTGWNLVGNPYNYAFPIGQIIGIPRGGPASNRSVTFAQLIAGQFTNGAFSYYDSTAKEYRTLSGVNASARLQPNAGYWVYVNQDVDLQFPPIYELFVRGSEPAESPQRFDNWKLQLGAASVTGRDTQNFVGIVRNASDAYALSARKAPMPPAVAGASTVYSYVTGDNGAAMASSLRRSSGAQTFKYNVMTQTRGPVTVSWPNIRSIPSNLTVKLVDAVTKRTIDARKSTGYTFNATGPSVRAFTVTVQPGVATKMRVTSSSYTTIRTGSVRQARVSFGVNTRGAATLELFKGSVRVASLASDLSVEAGQNVVVWPMTDLSGQPLPTGNYVLRIRATGDAGDTATYQTSMMVRR